MTRDSPQHYCYTHLVGVCFIMPAARATGAKGETGVKSVNRFAPEKFEILMTKQKTS